MSMLGRSTRDATLQEEVKVTSGSAHSIDHSEAVPRLIQPPTRYTDSGTVNAVTSTVLVSTSNSAGEKHIKLPTHVEADVLVELVAFEFTLAQKVTACLVGLLCEPGAIPEAHKLIYALNGDIVSDASALLDESDVVHLPVNRLVRISSGGGNYITRVAMIAVKGNASLTKTSNTSLEMVCIGMGEV